MPANLITPIEIVSKESVVIDNYKTVQIFVQLEGNPYIRVKYNAVNSSGDIVGTAEALIEGADVATFIANNPTFYTDVKNVSYQIGKDEGVIPSDAGIV